MRLGVTTDHFSFVPRTQRSTSAASGPFLLLHGVVFAILCPARFEEKSSALAVTRRRNALPKKEIAPRIFFGFRELTSSLQHPN